MNDVTRVLQAIERGDPQAAGALLPIVYQELRRLAAHRMQHEPRGHTLQATALVHEAYLRLVGSGGRWAGRGHFLAAAAEAMRRILIDHARAKGAIRRGGGAPRLRLSVADLSLDDVPAEVLDLHEALEKLAEEDAVKAKLVELRFFAGLTLDEAAEILGISPATADRHWTYARVWLYDRIRSQREG